MQERYFVSKFCNTSYDDVGNITPLERQYLLDFILEEQQKKKEYIEKAKAQQRANSKTSMMQNRT